MPRNNEKKPEVEDSASTPTSGVKEEKPEAKPQGQGRRTGGANRQKGKTDDTRPKDPTSNGSKVTPKGYSEGDSALLSYGLSVSGRKERIMSLVKTDKFFHFVEDAWSSLVDAKPSITERFSYAEFRHCAALQLYQRIENVKFDAIGVKPSAPTRIPLPRNLRVFQPIWAVLSNIGIVTDEELRVQYIPDASLPTNEDGSTEDDLLHLVSCTLYDWQSSWEAVLSAREGRDKYEERIGYHGSADSNESPNESQQGLIQEIAVLRNRLVRARRAQSSGNYRIVNGHLYRVPPPPTDHEGEWNPTDQQVTTDNEDNFEVPATIQQQLSDVMIRAKAFKEHKIRPKFSIEYQPQSYALSDGTISTQPGAYGAWLHWDPQLWLDYEQMTEIVSPVALFSLSMPVDTEGTYAWLLPVESREQSADVFCRMPKASIPPATWILALLLQASTLPLPARSTWYCETDRLSNVLGLRLKYIRAAIKRGAPTEQYGTY